MFLFTGTYEPLSQDGDDYYSDNDIDDEFDHYDYPDRATSSRDLSSGSQKVVCKCRALYDFNSTQSNELTVREGAYRCRPAFIVATPECVQSLFERVIQQINCNSSINATKLNYAAQLLSYCTYISAPSGSSMKACAICQTVTDTVTLIGMRSAE